MYATPFLSIGGKKRIITLKKSRGTAYRSVGSTINSISRNSTKSKAKVGHIMQQCIDMSFFFRLTGHRHLHGLRAV